MGQKQIVTGAEDSASYVAHIENLKSERATLETTTSSSTGTVTSPASGYFIHTVDGYENAVDTDDVEQLTVSDVRALEEGEAGSNADSTVIGKVAKEFNWYIACIIDENDLVRLDRTTNVKVEMPFATAETIPAEVVKINRDEASGDAVVILKCSYMNTDLAAARKEPLRIDLQSYTGVLVNEKAIHFADVTVTDTDTDGNVTEHVEQNVKGVYIKSGSRVRFVQVFSDATIDGYAVCKLNLSSSEKSSSSPRERYSFTMKSLWKGRIFMTEKCFEERFRDVEENYKVITNRIAEAAVRSGRKPEDITFLAATKTVPAEVINHAIGCGLRFIGENRVQEFMDKYEKIDWDKGVSGQIIGRLQTNKVKYIIDKVDCIQSVDSVKLAKEISRLAEKIGRKMPVLIEVNIGGEESKGGIEKAALPELLEEIAVLPGIQVNGLMAIPPICAEKSALCNYFSQMHQSFIDIRAKK